MKEKDTFRPIPIEAIRLEPAQPDTPSEFNIQGNIVFIKKGLLNESARERSYTNLAIIGSSGVVVVVLHSLGKLKD
jgi:hypothetical protein